MYQQLAKNLYLVHNSDEYDTLWSDRFPIKVERPANYVPDDVELLYPHTIKLYTDYPVLVAYSGDQDFSPSIVPVTKAVGSLGDLHLLDMSNEFEHFRIACLGMGLVEPPKLMLNSISITKRQPPKKPVGVIGHLHRTHNSHIIDAMVKGAMPAAKTLRIKYGDSRFHGGIEMNNEIMVVAERRDITHLIAKVEPTSAGGYDAEYVFNHHTFIHGIPELSQYTDTRRWDLRFSIDTVYTVNHGKKD